MTEKSNRPLPQAVPASPRETIQARFPSGAIYEAPIGAPVESFVKRALADGLLDEATPVVAALVNDQLRELTYSLKVDAELVPIPVTSSDGTRIYQRSLSFLLVTAVRELFQRAKIVIDHSLTPGGLYCTVQDWAPFTPDDLARIEARMREIVEEDAPITKRRIPKKEAVDLFRAQGYQEKVRLLNYRRKDYLTVYILREMVDYFYGYMVPSAGYLRWFELTHYPPGFILRHPVASRPRELLSLWTRPVWRRSFASTASGCA